MHCLRHFSIPARLIVFDDESHAPLKSEIVPYPLDKDKQAVAKADQMHQSDMLRQGLHQGRLPQGGVLTLRYLPLSQAETYLLSFRES